MKRAHMAMIRVPYDDPDRRTTMADLRIALCLECGVDIADIHPARGTDWSRSAYENSRFSWQRYIAEEPSARHSNPDRPGYPEARANWLQLHPEWDDDWLAPEATTAPEPDLIPLFELEAAA